MKKFLKIFGNVLIVGVILLCVPIAIPQLFGFGTYNVISGSMEPAISVGSLIYVEDVQFSDIREGEVIAFYSNGSLVTHRVVEIDKENCLFTTKGDANTGNDLAKVPYVDVIGKVALSLSMLGALGAFLSTFAGKTMAIALVILGIIMNLLADKLEEKPSDLTKVDEVELPKNKGKKGASKISLIVGLFIIVVALGFAYYILSDYGDSNQLYAELNTQYVQKQEEPQVQWQDMCQVDFDSLLNINQDVIGWIYVENTEISYPIMKGSDDEEYLHTGIDGNYAKAGSIFMEAANSSDYSDSHTIIYGHNMRNLSMFGSLKYYKTMASYMEDSQYFQIITPDGKKYRYQIFSFFDTEADGWVYTVPYAADAEFSAYISELKKHSYMSADVNVSQDDYVVTLSTCSAEDMRFVVNGVRVDTF